MNNKEKGKDVLRVMLVAGLAYMIAGPIGVGVIAIVMLLS